MMEYSYYHSLVSKSHCPKVYQSLSVRSINRAEVMFHTFNASRMIRCRVSILQNLLEHVEHDFVVVSRHDHALDQGRESRDLLRANGDRALTK